MKDRSFGGVVFRIYNVSFFIIVSFYREKSQTSLNLQGCLALSILFELNIDQ